MLAVGIDLEDMYRVIRNLGATVDQVPYSMALAMNEATEKTYNLLTKQTWPNKVTVRNPTFIRASLTTRGARASKHSLMTEIYDKLDRGHLMMHARGGVRTPKKGRAHMAIPVGNVIKKGARGVPKNLRPANLANDYRKGDFIFARRGRTGKPRLMYVLKTATPIPKRVPFFEDYQRSMAVELRKALPSAIAKAMATRRR